jgi:hypothetical protein
MPKRYEGRLAEAARLQSALLTAAATDPRRAWQSVQEILERHRDVRDDDPVDVRLDLIAPPENSDDAIGLLVAADELLVWERDLDTALGELQQHGLVPTVGVVTPRVRSLTFAGVGAGRLAEALELVRNAGLRVSFDHAVLHNDAGSLFSGLQAFMTAKGAAPPIELPDGTLPPRPTGAGGCGHITVAVIDSGVEAERDDPHLGRTDGWLVDVTGEDDPGTVGVDPSIDLGPGAGHGTAVAGVVQLVAPDVKVVVYRALHNGVGSEASVAEAIIRAGQDGADVINLSLGTRALPQHAPLALEDALSLLPDDVLVVAAAGNSASFEPHFPAAFKRVIAVAATEIDGTPAPYSNRGYWVDFATRGSGVATTFTQGRVRSLDASGNVVGDVDFAGQVPTAALTGTSFAAPQVAGRLAQLRARGLDPTEAVAWLAARGRAEPDFGVVVRLLDQ